MKINVNKKKFLKNLSIADSIISSKLINPILTNCLFKIEKNKLEIISSDNEISITSKLKIETDENGSFIANSKNILNLLKDFPDDDIILNINENYEISLESNSKKIKGQFKIFGMPGDDFPDIKIINKNKSIQIEQNILKEMIRKVITSASIDTIKPIFNGVFIQSNSNNELSAVATDSKKLSLITRKIDNEINLEKGIVLPLKTINEIYRLLNNIGTCNFYFEESLFFIEIDNTKILSRIVEGNFPNYKQVIPKEENSNIIIETNKLLEALKRILNFTREPIYKIILNFSKNNLKLEASTPGIGNAFEEIDVEYEKDENIQIGINAKFLIDSLKEIDSFSIIMGISGSMNPVTIKPDNDENYISVIMPIQIKN